MRREAPEGFVMIEQVFISPKDKLLNGVVQHLCEPRHLRRSLMGAPSLAHCMVIVPTSESGRLLRLALAQAFETQGLLAPRIVQPSHLVEPESSEFPEATPAELLAALTRFLSEDAPDAWAPLFRDTERRDTAFRHGFAQQCARLWHALSIKGYTFADVAASPEAQALFADSAPEEQLRWEQLAAFEADFFAFLHAEGRSAPVERFSRAKGAPKALDETIETIILPALADPLPILYDILQVYEQRNPKLEILVLLHAEPEERNRFDGWGRPEPSVWCDHPPKLDAELPNDSIHLYLKNAELADSLASHLAGLGPKATELGLAVPDNALFTSLELACRREGVPLHNPSLHTLSRSSLGRLTLNLLTLLAAPERSWGTIRALLHEDDVLAFLERQIPDFRRVTCLKELNAYQNEHFPKSFPEHLPAGAEEHYPVLAAALAALNALIPTESVSLTADLRRIFAALYAGRTGETMAPGACAELQGAIQALTRLLTDFEAPLPQKLEPAERIALFRLLLNQSTYSLEEEDPEAVKTLGWLELAWSRYECLILSGLTEGVVPDAVVGDAFLPNRLAQALGLKTNEQRLARDTFLLSEILRCRAPGRVHAALAIASDTGEIQKPSRLLFLCEDATLVERIGKLFGEIPSRSRLTERRVPEGWRLKLPEAQPVPPGGRIRISASAVDTYLTCPFTYYLSRVLRLQAAATKAEPEIQTFGTLLHTVLDAYAKDDTLRNLKEESAILEAVSRLFHREVRHLRSHHTKNLTLILDSLELRLRAFARIQAESRAAGWEIIESEYSFSDKPPIRLPDGRSLQLAGTIDRIDFKPGVGYRIIDYKTWNAAGDAGKRILSSSKDFINFYTQRRYPLIEVPNGKKMVTHALTSVQLPLYRHALELLEPNRFAGQIVSLAYCILGKTDRDSALIETLNAAGITLTDLYPQAIELLYAAISDIQAARFWPPNPTRCWERDYAALFLDNPQETLDPAWITDQTARFEAKLTGGACHD